MTQDNRFSSHDDEQYTNKDWLSQQFHASSDIVIKDYPKENVLLMFCEPLIDHTALHSNLLYLKENEFNLEELSTLVQLTTIKKESFSFSLLYKYLYDGYLYIASKEKTSDSVFFLNIAKIPARFPDESVSEVSTRGPKDGFIEQASVNVGLVRKRLKSPSFVVEDFTIGKRSNTNVSLLYIADIIDENILKTVKARLTKIKTDILTSSEELEDYLSDQKFSLFPLINYTGRPDFVTKAINQGRVALIVDGSPTALIAPANLSFLLKTAEDNNTSFYFASVERVIRTIGLLTSIFLPGFYTALTSHNLGQLPFPLIATISVSRSGLPFSNFLEMLIMLIMFELFKEAGARLPKGVGQTVAVLGGLIIGDAAIRGGITSPTMLVVVGVTAISSFTLVNQSLTGNLFIARIYILFLSSGLGLFGFFVGFLSLTIHVASLRSFGTSYVSFSKIETFKDLVSIFFRLPKPLLTKRAPELDPNDKTRGQS
ncbi:spore germination protein [Alkalihalophilus pseudofirmus]|uniref:spore germination protein n=1 Tax=Alkalihalophilus pseudofirmus TaxID=79885 RepID=UPI00095116B3|nr:spore germination protein [Alkalihalophilus pseudofirmus]